MISIPNFPLCTHRFPCPKRLGTPIFTPPISLAFLALSLSVNLRIIQSFMPTNIYPLHPDTSRPFKPILLPFKLPNRTPRTPHNPPRNHNNPKTNRRHPTQNPEPLLHSLSSPQPPRSKPKHHRYNTGERNKPPLHWTSRRRSELPKARPKMLGRAGRELAVALWIRRETRGDVHAYVGRGDEGRYA